MGEFNMKYLFLFIIIWVSPAFALPQQAINLLRADSFGQTLEALPLITQEPEGESLLQALSERQLFLNASNQLYIAKEPIAPQDLQIRTNNRVRGELANLLNQMSLFSKNIDKRLNAAKAQFNSPDILLLERALKEEQNKSILNVLNAAKAAFLLKNKGLDETQFAIIINKGDNEALTFLKSLQSSSLQQSAIKQIENSLYWKEKIQTLLFGLSLGSVLMLSAIGLSITFGVMGIINMAHGEMIMIGAYVTFLTQTLIKLFAPQLLPFSYLFALPFAFLVTALLGILIEWSVIRFLYGRPLETLLATFGVSLILQQAIRTLFGATNKEVTLPSSFQGSLEVLGISLNSARLFIFFLAIFLFTILLFVMRSSRLGLEMRAVTQNRQMAASMGVNTKLTDRLTFALGSGFAGLAGVALSTIDNISPNLGQNYILESFMVVVFGGVGSLWGTLISAFSLGVMTKFLEPSFGAVLAKIIILVLLILFIQKKPRGLFAIKGRFVQ